MRNIKACNISLNIIGVLAILTALFIWFWVFTIGLYISQYSSEMNKTASPFLLQVFGGIIGAFVIKIGIGIFRREPWARMALFVFWLFVSFCIIAIVLSGASDPYSYTHDEGETAFWLSITAIAIAHAIFLSSKTVKELFSNEG